MKHHEFILRVRARAAKLPSRQAFMAVTLALQIDPDTLPDDLDAASDRLINLIIQVKREIPA